MNQILAVAEKILEPAVNAYQAKSRLYYPTMRDKQGEYMNEVEADEQSTICEDCYSKAMIFFRARSKLGKYKKDGAYGVDLELESSPEKESMCICGFCGEHIDVSLLFRDSQEVDHWMENVSDQQLAIDIKNPRDAWQLNQIVTSEDAFEHILHDVMPLAIRIIQASK